MLSNLYVSWASKGEVFPMIYSLTYQGVLNHGTVIRITLHSETICLGLINDEAIIKTHDVQW